MHTFWAIDTKWKGYILKSHIFFDKNGQYIKNGLTKPFQIVIFTVCVFGLISETSHAGSNMPIYGFSLIHWFYYIDQPHNPSFPKGLVKTESNFIIKSLETDHFSVDWCLSFFDFLRPDLSPWGYRNVLSGCIAPPFIIRRPNLEVATKRFLH